MSSRPKRATSAPITPASAVSVSLIQFAGVIAIIGSMFAAWYAVRGDLTSLKTIVDSHTTGLAKDDTKLDSLTQTVTDLHEKQAVAATDQKHIADQLTDIVNRITTIQSAVVRK